MISATVVGRIVSLYVVKQLVAKPQQIGACLLPGAVDSRAALAIRFVYSTHFET
jgi:hypothetical protein